MLADGAEVIEVPLPLAVGLPETEDGYELEIVEVPNDPVGPLVKVPFETVGYGTEEDEPESLLELPVPRGTVPLLETGDVPVGPVGPLVKVPFEGVGYGTDEDEPESVLELPVPKGAVTVLDGELPVPSGVDVAVPSVPVPSDGRV